MAPSSTGEHGGALPSRRRIARCVAILAVALGGGTGGCGHAEPGVAIGPRADAVLRVPPAREIAAFLADPAFGGRMVGTPGNRRAGQYLAEQFAAAGLRPSGAAGADAWLQPIPVACIRTPGAGCRLQAGGRTFKLHEDFSPIACGRAGDFAGPLAFAGFGYHDPVTGYDDYKGLDASGAVVMILQGTPAGTGPRSIWWTKGAALRGGLLAAKLKSAAGAGAAAVLIVSPPEVGLGGDVLYSVLGDGRGPIPAMRISRAAADSLLAAADANASIAGLAEASRTRRGASFRTATRVSGRVELAEGLGSNVVGILPAAAGPGAACVVIGAHYDHLSADGARAADAGVGVRPGADDNASGATALVLLARALASQPRRELTYVFVAFDGEEYGFNGSRHYVQHPAVPLERTRLMINLDQLGRFGRNGLTVLGDTSREPFRTALLAAASDRPGLRLRKVPLTSKEHWSDQAAFAKAGVATLFFYTGRHADYHRMTDTLDRLDVAGLVGVARMVLRTILALERMAAPAAG